MGPLTLRFGNPLELYQTIQNYNGQTYKIELYLKPFVI